MRQHPDDAVIARIAALAGPTERFAVRSRAFWVATTEQLSTTAQLRAIGAGSAGQGTFRSASALAKITAAKHD